MDEEFVKIISILISIGYISLSFFLKVKNKYKILLASICLLLIFVSFYLEKSEIKTTAFIALLILIKVLFKIKGDKMYNLED